MPEPRHRWPFLIVLAAVLGTTGARGQDLDAGKTGPQLFAQDCSACHRSPQGLAKNMGSGSRVGFLRQHYTSSSTSAGVVAAYVLANAGNPRADKQKARPGEDQAKQSGQAQDRSRLARPAEPTAAPPSGEPGAVHPVPSRKQQEKLARPGDPSAAQPGRPSRKSPRPGDPAEAPAAEPAAAQAATPAAPETASPATAAGGTGTAPMAGRQSATVQPSFAEPLP